MLRREPLRNQKVDLELTNLVPKPTDDLTMPAGLHLGFQRHLVVVQADRHGCCLFSRVIGHARGMPRLQPCVPTCHYSASRQCTNTDRTNARFADPSTSLPYRS